MDWLKEHLIEVLIMLTIIGTIAAVIIAVVAESGAPPCLRYETQVIPVYDASLKMTRPQVTQVCVERAAER